MTYDEFINYFRSPETLKDMQPEQLKEFVSKYPYFRLAKWLYLKSLQLSDSIYFEQESKKTVLFAPDRRNLYYYIYPEELTPSEPFVLRNDNPGSYFDMLNKLDSKNGNNRSSLKLLAEKFKAARETLSGDSVDAQPASVKLPADTLSGAVITVNREDTEKRENYAKQLVREKKYREAIQILEELNLNNPKKSIYFADQIRFLKKIIEN